MCVKSKSHKASLGHFSLAGRGIYVILGNKDAGQHPGQVMTDWADRGKTLRKRNRFSIERDAERKG